MKERSGSAGACSEGAFNEGALSAGAKERAAKERNEGALSVQRRSATKERSAQE